MKPSAHGITYNTERISRSVCDFDAYPEGYSDWISYLESMEIEATREGNIVLLNGGQYNNDGFNQLPSKYKY